MGLVQNLAKKFRKAKTRIKNAITKTPDYFVFENFIQNFDKNQKFFTSQWKEVVKDLRVIQKRKGIKLYLPEGFEEIARDLVLDIVEITDSGNYGFNFADIVTASKYYAANYMTTDEGKTLEEVNVAAYNVGVMIDSMNFNFMAHINYETMFWAEQKGNKMAIVRKVVDEDKLKASKEAGTFKLVDKEGYPWKLLAMKERVAKQMFNIRDGIMNADRDMVFKGFINLCDKDIYKLNDDYKVELGLQK